MTCADYVAIGILYVVLLAAAAVAIDDALFEGLPEDAAKLVRGIAVVLWPLSLVVGAFLLLGAGAYVAGKSVPSVARVTVRGSQQLFRLVVPKKQEKSAPLPEAKIRSKR